jgi:hypothetical protein
MAVVIVNEMRGADQSLYDEVNPRVMPGGQLPEGCRVHIASPIDDGWRVITVWDSEEQFQEFRDTKLIPTLQESGYGDRVAPSITAQPVHNLLGV